MSAASEVGETPEQRDLTDLDSIDLRPGDGHYRAYVGPPGQYDFMGASQFRLLTTLGLREHHRVLDLGCGSLRLGRLLIPYLSAGNYTGLDPNRWLIDDALDRQLGRDVLEIKAPAFHFNDDFDLSGCGGPFDMVVAQSILSHTGEDLSRAILGEVAGVVGAGGLAAITFVEDAQWFQPGREATGWVYPACVGYTDDEVQAMASDAGLACRAIPWFHPRQTWYLFAADAAVLPDPRHDSLLRGAVLGDPEFAAGLPAEEPPPGR